jgi:hypothetical protein
VDDHERVVETLAVELDHLRTRREIAEAAELGSKGQGSVLGVCVQTVAADPR